MINIGKPVIFILVCVHFLIGGCTSDTDDVVQLKHYSLDNTEWTTQEIPFSLKKGENPDDITFNLVTNGTGTVWIDHIRLLKGLLT
jgi:hypothetical protein